MQGLEMDSLRLHEDDDSESKERIKAHKRRWMALKVNAYSQQKNPIEAFYTQQEALQYSARDPELRVWAMEYITDNPGKRKFLVAKPRSFYNVYYTLSQRHHYELIEEQKHCNLYFDLEFPWELNPDARPFEMMAIFKAEIASQIQRLYEIQIDPISDIVDMTSTRSKKFSRHLIVNIPGAVFQNYSHVAAFVSRLVFDIEVRLLEGEARLNKLFVNTSSSSTRSIFLDPSVYSKNRQFRLVDSCKIGTSSFLQLCNGQDESVSKNRAPTFRQFAKTLVCPLLPFEYGDDAFPRILECYPQETRPRQRENSPEFSTPRIGRSSSAGRTESPYPDIDAAFLLALRTVEKQQLPGAFISSTVFYPASGSFVYTIGGSRFCGNVGRQHRSNGVYYVMKDGKASQRCFDPECKFYQGGVFDVEIDSKLLEEMEVDRLISQDLEENPDNWP